MQQSSASYDLVGIVLILLFKPIIDALRSPLRHIPGPLLARFTRLWYFLHVKNGQFHTENLELHRNYGKVVRYAPGRYSISDTDALKTIYTFGQGFNKSGRRIAMHNASDTTYYYISKFSSMTHRHPMA
ncbi:hypothetical protein LTR17_026042 [Elasticomyces elasticus]|nr:hypothetical protein LTR17_026042 [Elasticomyces elasticus]